MEGTWVPVTDIKPHTLVCIGSNCEQQGEIMDITRQGTTIIFQVNYPDGTTHEWKHEEGGSIFVSSTERV